MKKPIKLLILIGILLLASAFFVGPYLIKNVPFVYGGDLQPQGYAYYTDLQNLVSLKAIFKYFRLPFYSWDLFLGNNFWSSKSLNGLSDIFNYLTLWLPLHFYTVFEIHTVLKIVVSGITFFFLAKAWKDEFKANLTVALAYAVSSWMIYFIGQPTFASFYAWLPLFFLGIEHYYKSKNPLLYILAIALLLLTNYYLFFSVVVFTAFYTSYRYYVLNLSFKGFVPSTLWLLGYAIVGSLISGFVVIPNVLYLLSNDRVGKFEFAIFFKEFRIYLHELIGQFLPSHLVIYQDNPFETKTHNTREILMWAGSLVALLVPQFIVDKDRYFRKATTLLYLAMSIILLIPMGDAMMHGLSEPSFRWLFIWIIMNLHVANRYLADPESIDLPFLKKSLIAIILLAGGIYGLSMAMDKGLSNVLATYPRTTYAFAISLVFILLSYLALTSTLRYKASLILLIVFVELVSAGYINLVQRRLNPARSWDFELRATKVLQDTPNQLNQYLSNLDPVNATQFYRVYVPHESLYWSYSHNMSVFYQLQGLMTYDSMYAPSFNQMKLLTDEVRAFSSDWLFNIQQKDLVNFLNMKYAIVVNESELPKGQFTLITNTYRGGLSIYRNDNYRPLGTLYANIATYDVFKTVYHNKLSMLLDTVISNTDDAMAIQNTLGSNLDLVWNGINHYDNHLDGSFATQSKGFMVLTIPYDAGWKIKLNGKSIQSYEVNGGFIGIPVEEGEQVIEMDFVPVGFKEGAIMTVLGSMAFILIALVTLKRKKTNQQS